MTCQRVCNLVGEYLKSIKFTTMLGGDLTSRAGLLHFVRACGVFPLSDRVIRRDKPLVGALSEFGDTLSCHLR
jgi:hypothetical protein